MSARFLVTYPCQNECGVVETGRFEEGCPVQECPGCGTEWIDVEEPPRPARRPEEENPFLAPYRRD